jgi:hypothetical protein
VEGSSILDNALIAIEITHALNRKTRGLVTLHSKLTLLRHMIKWIRVLLRGMFERLGFADKWIHWMMLCVSSVNYSVLVNFEKIGPIYPSRGLRQGGPLSPYLFILVAKGVTTFVRHSVARGDIHGVKICRGAHSVYHLFFPLLMTTYFACLIYKKQYS